MNIIVRSLLYLAQSLQDYLDERGEDLYGSRKVNLPETELYVIYTGERVSRPEEVSLTEEFFENKKSAIEVKVKILYGTVNPDKTEGEDIVGQYVLFTKVYNEQIRQHRRTAKAVAETIRICKDRDILKEYLATREKEVITMIMSLYDQDRIMKIHVESEKRIAAEKAAREEKEASIRRMLRDGTIPAEKIASYMGVSVEEVREVEAGMLQEV
ncbi:MAG: hypothetical protein LUH20_09695 [Lachnospiraceae bacterium]|nr:hypothetical protein [Lachnospiraceae bacterium]